MMRRSDQKLAILSRASDLVMLAEDEQVDRREEARLVIVPV